MKAIRTLILIFVSGIILWSCNNDNEDKVLQFDSLAQTSWHGTMLQVYDGGKESIHSDVGMIFYSDEKGQYDIKYKTGSEPERDEFTYAIDKKMLHIKNNVLLNGYWLLINKSKDKMVLEQSIGGEYSYKWTLTLNRTH